MRLLNAPMTADEFESYLLDALDGTIVSDTGADDELDRALNAIAAAESPTPAQIAAARTAFAALPV